MVTKNLPKHTPNTQLYNLLRKTIEMRRVWIKVGKKVLEPEKSQMSETMSNEKKAKTKRMLDMESEQGE